MIFSHKFLTAVVIVGSSCFASCAEEVQSTETQTQAAQSQIEENAEPLVIEGDLFVTPNMPCEIGDECAEDFDGYDINGLSGEPCIDVWATSRGKGDHWWAHRHKRLSPPFPRCLPAYVFRNSNGTLKKEGDIITISHTNNQTNEELKLRLTLSQSKYKYRHCGEGDFGACARELITDKKIYWDRRFTELIKQGQRKE